MGHAAQSLPQAGIHRRPETVRSVEMRLQMKDLLFAGPNFPIAIRAMFVSPRHPVFRPFDENWLFTTNTVSSALVTPIRSRILADGIPATSFAAGANFIGGDKVVGNIDYGTCKSGEWPRNKGRWLHSDIKSVAFLFNHLFFKKLVNGDSQ